MKLYEKTLEINITHELLNLSDSWLWFLTDSPLWRYWRPRPLLPFFKMPRSTGAGFHITSEGKSDPKGETGGGFDVRIKSATGGHLLFIQYKLGDFENRSPGVSSIFSTPPHEHYSFKINSPRTNQHFLLRELAGGIGTLKGNAVVYALPLIKDMGEMEAYSGKLIRKTKFISIKDIDDQAVLNGVPFVKGSTHQFRVGEADMKRCEVNKDFFAFNGMDRTSEILADLIAINFEKALRYFTSNVIKNQKRFRLDEEYIAEGIQRAYFQYIRYLLHYFEVHPRYLQNMQEEWPFDYFFDYGLFEDEFKDYRSDERDVGILLAIDKALNTFRNFLQNPHPYVSFNKILADIPRYKPLIFINLPPQETMNIEISNDYKQEAIDGISYLKI